MRLTGFITIALACVLLLADSTVCSSDAPAPPPRSKDDAVRSSIQRGLEYLAKRQDMKTGAIGGDSAYTLAYTSLGGMAFISGGNLPGRGIYSQNVEMAVRFIVERAAAQSGYIQYYSSNMYSHGFAALFLAEVYGNIPARMGLQPKVVKALKRAVHLIEKCQGAAGGWGYNPQVANSDLSITVCETNALRAARNAGVAVDKRVVERAIKCVKDGQCQDGGFVYQVYPGAGRSGGQASVGCSAGSVCVLEALGAYDDPALKLGLEYLKRFIGDGKNRGSWGFYITYYLSQAMFMAGEENWNKWWPLIKQSLLSQQQRDGSWPGSEAGPEYSSAVALIVLQMPYRYLPLYQEGIESADNRPRE